MDGALWLKDYVLKNHETLVKAPRFESVYLPEIEELLNDESNDVRIEAIEAILCVLQVLDVKLLEEEFIPNLIRAFNFEKNSEDNIRRMAKLSG
jgi:predicted RNA methylase